MTLTIDSLLAIGATTLALLGLIVTYALLKIVNLAHGEMVAIGAYAAFVVAPHGGGLLPLCLSGFIVSAVVGAVLEYSVVRRFYGRSLAMSLLGTWGISLAIVQLLRLIFGPAGRFVAVPLSGTITLRSSPYPLYRLIVLTICFAVLSVLIAASRSRLGVNLRASLESSWRAQSYGINTESTFRWAFIAGAGLAGLAGALLAPITAVYPNMGGEFTTLGFVAILLTRTQNVTQSIVACAFLGAARSLFASAFDSTTATLLMYASASIVLLGLPYVVRTGPLKSWRE